MTFTNAELLDAFAAVEWLNEQRLNMAAAQQVRRMKNALAPDAKIAKDLVSELFKRYGERDPKTGGWKVLRDDDEASAEEREEVRRRFKEFEDEHASLNANTVEIERVPTISEKDLWYRGKDESRIPIDISGRLIEQLGPLYVESEE